MVRRVRIKQNAGGTPVYVRGGAVRPTQALPAGHGPKKREKRRGMDFKLRSA